MYNNNKWARKPKEESKISLIVTRRYWAYDPEGVPKGEVTLTNDSKRRFEARGFTFKAVKS